MTFIVFVAVDLAPGDPAAAALGIFANEEQRAQFIEEKGLNDPVLVRFVRFLGQASHGDLGVSIIRPARVGELVAQAIPVTLQLTALAVSFAVGGALLVGVAAAAARDSWLDPPLRVWMSASLAAPDFWIGIVAIQFFVVMLGLLPPGGYVSFGSDPVAWLYHLLLPASVLAVPLGGALAVLVRAAMIQELERDYVRTARGAGLPGATVLMSALRNAAPAPLTVLGVRAGFMLSGAIVTEQIFNLPGLGTLLIEGVRQGDLAVVRAVALVGTLAIILTSLVVDLTYLLVNPKLRG